MDLELMKKAGAAGYVGIEVEGGDFVTAYASGSGLRLSAAYYVVKDGAMMAPDDSPFRLDCEVVELRGARTIDRRVSVVVVLVSDVSHPVSDSDAEGSAYVHFDLPVLPVGARAFILYDAFRNVGCICRVECDENKKHSLAKTPGFETLSVDGAAVDTIKCGSSFEAILKALTGIESDDAAADAGGGKGTSAGAANAGAAAPDGSKSAGNEPTGF